MNVETLLAELEGATHATRTRRMVELGRNAAAGDAAAAALVTALRAGDTYMRLLALQTVYGSRDGALVRASLSDPSRAVRGRATALLPLACSDTQIADAFPLVAASARPRLLIRLRRRHRDAAVDAAVRAHFLANEDPRAIDLAPYGTGAIAAEVLPALDDRGGHVTWARLARWHPAAVCDALHALLAKAGGALDPRLRWRCAAVLPTLAKSAPDAALRLVEPLFERGETVPVEVLRALVRRRPVQTFDLLRKRFESGRPTAPPGAFGGVRFDAVVRRLGLSRLVWLVENAWGALSDGDRGRRWLLSLPEDDREGLVSAWLARGRGAWGGFLLRHAPPVDARRLAAERWSAAARDREGIISLGLLAPLPRDLRTAEARRHLEQVTALTARPRDRMTYARFLPFEEAKVALAPFLGHPEGEERAAALATLVAVGRFEPCLTDLLEMLHARRFEQDPVRMAMLRALVELPVARFRAEHLPPVGAVVRDALDAADLSWGSAAAVEQLVVRLFRVDPAWGARWLTTLLETRGSVSAMGLGAALTAAEVRAMSPVLASLAETWATRERAGALLWLATSLAHRLSECPPLLEALERLATELPFAGVAGRALYLLQRHDPRRFTRLVPALLATDPSYAIVPQVARFLSMHRQDLLGPFLAQAPIGGRFATGKTRWILDFQGGYVRWTPAQQALHARALADVAAEEKRDVPAVRAAVQRLPDLVFVPASLLLPFAADARQPVREIAVRALPWLDAGEGLPVLLECLGDDRARWAIYALRKAFSEMSRPRVLEVLRAAPTTKVTVAKEVVRLLGELGGDEAWHILMAMNGPGLHRDVRIAVLRGLWDHLHREATWDVFGEAVRDPDWVVASRLADLPLDRLSPSDEARVLGLLVQVLGRPEPEARLTLLGRTASLPVRDTHRLLFRRLVEHLSAPTEAESVAALGAVLSRALPSEAEVVAARLKAQFPRRRVLLGLLAVLQARVGPYAPQVVQRVSELTLADLAQEPLLTTPWLRLAGFVLGWRDLGAAFLRASDRGLLHADAMVAAVAAVQRCVHPELLEDSLARRREPELRRLAVECLRCAAGPQDGWTLPRRNRLAAYQRDPAPLVAEAALLTFPPDA